MRPATPINPDLWIQMLISKHSTDIQFLHLCVILVMNPEAGPHQHVHRFSGFPQLRERQALIGHAYWPVFWLHY